MNGPIKLVAPLVAALAVAACNAGGSSSVPGSTGVSGAAGHSSPATMHHVSSVAEQLRSPVTPACGGSRIGQAQCDVLVHTGDTGLVAGWTPAELDAAYNLPTTKGSGQIVAIVDAFDNPDVATDLATYRSEFELPTANFTKYNQEGQQGNYPSGSPGWGVEIALDVEMVSASCPNCTIYLIEANSNSSSDLGAAEVEAVKLGAHIVSNSYSGTGDSESNYDTAGVTYLASAGDNGYGLIDPATFQEVVAVGGTELSQQGSKFSEVVWPFSGAGCSSTGESKPSWQHDPKCSLRTGNDISAVAVNAAEYDTYSQPGWITVNGTSISSPLMGGVFGLAGNATKQDGGKNFWKLKKKKLKKDLHYISSGMVVHCPPSLGGTYLCQAGTKQFKTYSGPTGWGSPNGIGAF